MCHRAEKLVVLNNTPIGASALCALGATHYVYPQQTAEEQSAAFALISELLDANCLDYRAARHDCGQVGTTIFEKLFTYSSENKERLQNIC